MCIDKELADSAIPLGISGCSDARRCAAFEACNGEPSQGVSWTIFDRAESLFGALSQYIGAVSAKAISSRGAFYIVLTGGRTACSFYQYLRQLDTDWKKWHIFMSDERCLLGGDANRNSRLIKDELLSKTKIPEHQMHFMPAELGPETGAAEYRGKVASSLPFDMTLLSMGQDGHVASIFSDTNAASRSSAVDLVLPIRNAPGPWSQRVSLSLGCLARSTEVLLLAVGPDKQRAVKQLADGASIPAAQLADIKCISVWADSLATKTVLGKNES